MVDKKFFVEQLRRHVVASLATTERAKLDANDAAQHMATEAEKKEDSRVALEFSSMAKAQALRAQRAHAELDQLDAFVRSGLPTFTRKTPIALGALVDLAACDEGDAAERSVILLPVGAGTELTGPGGDGFLSVITPSAPLGKALMGKRVGDAVDVTTRGEVREWTVVDVS